MGVRLIVEVLDHWQDAGLTAGERWDLLVLAENANDGSRLTFGPVHAPHILQRANKSPKGWKNAITALMRKKVITTHVPGRIKQVAVYHLEHLCPEPPHDGYKGHCTRPAKGQEEGYPSANPAPEEGHLSDDPVSEEGHPADDPMGHLSDDPLGQEGHPADAERVIQEVTPTPPYSSFKDSPLTTSSTSLAEDSAEDSVVDSDGTDGGGGGSHSLEEINKQCERVDAFVATLDFRGKPPSKQQRLKIGQRIMVAFTAGWTEKGLARYLDLSDEANVRSAAALYLHRLSEDELPDNVEEEGAGLPPVCSWCKVVNPAAEFNARWRLDPLGRPCPQCHPTSVAQKATVNLPPLCEDCAQQPGADTNPNVRIDPMSFHGDLCPKCHPSKVPGNWSWPGRERGKATGARAETPAAGAYAASSVDDLYAPSVLPGDRNTLGWLALSKSLGSGPQPMIANTGYQPYEDPIDQSVYDEDL